MFFPHACFNCLYSSSGNSRDECNPTEETIIQKSNFSSFKVFTAVFFASILGLAIALCLFSFIYETYKNRSESLQSSFQRRLSFRRRAKEYTFDKMGKTSVYSFFLGKSWSGWTIALAVLGVQLWVLFVYISGAEKELSNDKSDFRFTWKCFRDQEKCENDSNLDASGWIIFGILMFSHLARDIINGTKMIFLSAKSGYNFNTRARFFLGGFLLITVTAFTLFASVVYNKAIATSNTDIITNAVVILIVMDLDEQFFEVFDLIDARTNAWFGGIKEYEKMHKETGSSTIRDATGSQIESITRELLCALSREDLEDEMKKAIKERYCLFWDDVTQIEQCYKSRVGALDEEIVSISEAQDIKEE